MRNKKKNKKSFENFPFQNKIRNENVSYGVFGSVRTVSRKRWQLLKNNNSDTIHVSPELVHFFFLSLPRQNSFAKFCCQLLEYVTINRTIIQVEKKKCTKSDETWIVSLLLFFDGCHRFLGSFTLTRYFLWVPNPLESIKLLSAPAINRICVASTACRRSLGTWNWIRLCISCVLCESVFDRRLLAVLHSQFEIRIAFTETMIYPHLIILESRWWHDQRYILMAIRSIVGSCHRSMMKANNGRLHSFKKKEKKTAIVICPNVSHLGYDFSEIWSLNYRYSASTTSPIILLKLFNRKKEKIIVSLCVACTWARNIITVASISSNWPS